MSAHVSDMRIYLLAETNDPFQLHLKVVSNGNVCKLIIIPPVTQTLRWACMSMGNQFMGRGVLGKAHTSNFHTCDARHKSMLTWEDSTHKPEPTCMKACQLSHLSVTQLMCMQPGSQYHSMPEDITEGTCCVP